MAKNEIESALADAQKFKKEALQQIDGLPTEFAREALDIVNDELVKGGNPYTVRLYKLDEKTFTILPDDQEKAFTVEIGGPFSEPGSSFTENEKNEIIRKASQRINRLAADYAGKGYGRMRIKYTIGNPTS